MLKSTSGFAYGLVISTGLEMSGWGRPIEEGIEIMINTVKWGRVQLILYEEE